MDLNPNYFKDDIIIYEIYKLIMEITLCRSGAKLVTSNIVSFDANNYT